MVLGAAGSVYPTMLHRAQARHTGGSMTASVLDRCGLGVAFVDTAGVVRHSNGLFASLLGIHPGEEPWVLPMLADIPPDLSGAITGTRAWRGELGSTGGATPGVMAEVLPFDGAPGSDAVGVLLLVRKSVDGHVAESPERCWRVVHQFAGGLTHEFNNALASIQGFAEIASSCGDERQAMRERCLENILKGCEVARSGIRRGRMLGGKVDLAVESCQLSEYAGLWCRSREATLPVGMRIEMDVHDPLPRVSLDPAFMQVAFDALWDNAVAAMQAGGILNVAVQPGGSPDWPVMMELLDTGCGMAPDVLDRCLEPYFTTREAGGAEGLGLSLANGIVRAHGGRLAVSSFPGRGTMVRVWLPRSRQAAV